MKWLILIFLVSCGNQEPKAIDLADHDGDQILNHLESDYDKYVATYEKLDVVRGVIKHASFKSPVTFSNYSTSAEDVFKLMTGERLSPAKMDYFSEWKILSIDFSNVNIQVSSDINILQIHFEPTKIEPDELVLRNRSFIRSFGKWSSYMKIQLSNEEFQGLLNGSAILELKKSFHKGAFQETESDQTIKDKTQKVYIQKESEVEVLYVSKNIPSEKLYSILGIESATKVDTDLLFFDSPMNGVEQWFEREVEGQKVFILTTNQNLKKSFQQKLRQSKFQLRRENGVPLQSFQVSLEGRSNVYLKIRPHKVIRTFSERIITKKYRLGTSQLEGRCHYFMREISSETSTKTKLEDLIDNSNFYNEPKDSLIFGEQVDDLGTYWEIKYTSDSAATTLALIPRPESTFTITGQYDVACHGYGTQRHNKPSYRTNDENSLSFDIESYVEKIP